MIEDSRTTNKKSLTYSSAGVDDSAADSGLNSLLRWIKKTHNIREGFGGAKLGIGHFANVVDVGRGLGVAISTDTTGSKILIAEMIGKYDTIGIDCVAINVNDILCVGAEPVAFVDCISLEKADPRILEQIGKGLYLGAERSKVSIVGGEIAQVKDIIKGYKPGLGLDLAGTCIGIVPIDEIITGDLIQNGDILLGVSSSGIHCNGLSLARKALFDEGAYDASEIFSETGRTFGEELLQPTKIYVDEVMSLLNRGIDVKGLAHITGNGGFPNLTRLNNSVGYIIDNIPTPQPVFDLIQKTGNIDAEEMFRVYNMGIGFCIVVDSASADDAMKVLDTFEYTAYRMGYVVDDPSCTVKILSHNLVGTGNRYHKDA